MNWQLLRNGVCFVILGLLGSVMLPLRAEAQQNGAESVAEAAVRDATHSFSDMKVSGTLNTTYNFRNYAGRSDNDIYSFFSLRLDDIVKDRVDGVFSMFWHEDLDGTTRLRADESYDPFLDIDQAASRRFRYYTGYVNIHGVGFDESTLRLGRQFMEEIDFAHFDGGAYRFEPIEDLEIKLFGGKPVSFYSSTSGDAIWGTNVEYRFSEHTKGAARYYRYDANGINDDLGAIEGWHRWSPWMQSHLKFSLLNAEPYILQTDHWLRLDAIDMDVFLQAIRLFEPVSESTLNFNPYFPLLNSYAPFTYGSVSAIKGLGEYLSVNAGIDVRQVDTLRDPVAEFTNRDYLRGIVGVEVYPTQQVTLAVNAEFWDVDSRDRFTGVSGEIEYRPTPQWTLIAGAEYGEYVQVYRDEFLYFFGEEKTFRINPNVVTYYSRVRWRPVSRFFSTASFEFEDNSEDKDDWYGFRLQMGVTF